MKLSQIGLGAIALAASTTFVGAAAQAAAAPYQPSVLVFNQKAPGGEATITYAYIPNDGFVALYASDPQKNPDAKAVGEAALPAGDSRDIRVKLAPAAKAGETLWAELRLGKITDWGASKPVMLDGKPVDQAFILK